MTTVPVFREMTAADRKRFGAKLPRGKPVTLAPEPSLRKIDPREAAEQVTMGILGSMLKDRESFAILVKTMRNIHGTKVSWMTDEQVARHAQMVYEDMVRESLNKAYAKRRRKVSLGR